MKEKDNWIRLHAQFTLNNMNIYEVLNYRTGQNDSTGKGDRVSK